MNLSVIHPSWQPVLSCLNQEAFLTFKNEILPNTLYYPEAQHIFRVFCMPLSQIKVVILGSGPYPVPQQSSGLAFATKEGIRTPASLKIIQKELDNLGLAGNSSLLKSWSSLEHWQEQGVFLLNIALTVESGNPGSHEVYWEDFIKRVIYFIGSKQPCIWLLWGHKAQRFAVNLPAKSVFRVQGYDRETIKQIPISEDYNYVLKAEHPGSEAFKTDAGFLNCNHFLYVNEILSRKREKIINW